jgi:hypothetical protein
MRAIADFAREANSGLIPIPSPALVEHRDLVISLATRLRLPNVYAYAYSVVIATSAVRVTIAGFDADERQIGGKSHAHLVEQSNTSIKMHVRGS